MKKLSYIVLAVVLMTAGGCGIFGKYNPQTSVPDNLFGSDSFAKAMSQDSSIATISWREFFTDPCLRDLIDTALARNTDAVTARLKVEEAKAALTAAKLGFLPAISFTPSLNLTPGNSYSLPFNLQWGTDGFGSITNKKREANALALQAMDYEKYVRSGLVSTVAGLYAQLLLYDKQLEIMKEAETLFAKAVETQKALMENGKAYSTSVNQLEASLLNVSIMKIDAENVIRNLESSMCIVLHQTPQPVRRSSPDTYELRNNFGTGIPAGILANRPDIRMAEHSLEAAFYVTNGARAAMIPGLSLTGLLGWANNGMAITDPLNLVYNAVLSLAQPVFAQGKLSANLKISKLQQQEAAEQFAQAVINAGNEVNMALADCQMAVRKDELYKKQVSILKDAFDGTRLLMDNGKTTYLEVLTAQESYLDAMLQDAVNIYNGTQSLIDLYEALGGGVE